VVVADALWGLLEASEGGEEDWEFGGDWWEWRDYAKFYRGMWLIKCRGSVAKLCQNNNDFRIVPKQ